MNFFALQDPIRPFRLTVAVRLRGHEPAHIGCRLASSGVDQKSIVTLNRANRAEVIDNGFKYVAVGLRSVGEYDVW